MKLDETTAKPGIVVTEKKRLLVEKIKTMLREHVYYAEKQLKVNLSTHLSEKMEYHFTYLANVFSAVEGQSIQRFYIRLKIDRAKELLREGKRLTEIETLLHYSSLAHLSNQFKKLEGITPSQYVATLKPQENAN